MKLYSGIKVLDLSRILVGPYATMILSDLGAEVLKIESFDGDETRRWGPPYLGEQSTYFLSINRNKKSICIDLKKGTEIIYELAKICDIVVENFSSGVTERLKIDYKSLSSINERLIYASINGFGNRGQMKNEQGFDIITQGLTGFMHITGEKDGPPSRVGVAINDILTGLHATNGIQAALYNRQKTGKGCHIETSLFEASIASLANVTSMYINANKDLHRLGNAHTSIAPYGTFKTDDDYIVLGVAQDNQFQQLCRVLGMDELAYDEKFIHNKDRVINKIELTELIEQHLKNKDIKDIIQQLKKGKVPVGKVQSVGECLESDQAKELGIVIKVGDEKMIRSPLSFNGEHLLDLKQAPKLNEHRDYVLSLIGRSDVSDLIRQGILKE